MHLCDYEEEAFLFAKFANICTGDIQQDSQIAW